jgi:hypothetical protein
MDRISQRLKTKRGNIYNTRHDKKTTGYSKVLADCNMTQD